MTKIGMETLWLNARWLTKLSSKTLRSGVFGSITLVLAACGSAESPVMDAGSDVLQRGDDGSNTQVMVPEGAAEAACIEWAESCVPNPDGVDLAKQGCPAWESLSVSCRRKAIDVWECYQRESCFAFETCGQVPQCS